MTYRFEFDGDVDASAMLGRRRRARVPAPCRARRRGRARTGSGAVRRRARRRASGATDERRRTSLARIGVGGARCGSSSGSRWPSSITSAVAAPARHPPRAGGRRCSPACVGWGIAVAVSPSASTAGTGAPTASCCTSSPSASRRRWPPRSPSTCSPVPARWRSASAPGSSSRRARCARSGAAIAVFRRYRELVRLARREGFGPFCRGRAAPSASTSRGGPPAPCARGGRRRLRQARPDRRHPRRPAADRRVRRAGRAAEPGAARARARTSPRCSRPSSATTSTRCSPSSTGSRWRRRRSARPTGPGCAPGEAVVVKVQRPGIEATMERDLAALALLADLAQRRTPFGRGCDRATCSPSSPTGLRAELDFRREADAMTRDGRPARRRQRRCGSRRSTGTCARRRVLVQERFEGVTVTDAARLDGIGVDRARARRPAAALDARPGDAARASSTPTRIPGNVFVLDDGTLGLIDFGAVGRLDPIQQAAIVDILLRPRPARRRAAARRRRARRRRAPRRRPPDELERALARLMAEHVRPGGHDRPERDAGAGGRAVRLRHAPARPTSCCCRARSSRVDGTLRVLCPGRSLMASAMDS